jgi:hypothetical protein
MFSTLIVSVTEGVYLRSEFLYFIGALRTQTILARLMAKEVTLMNYIWEKCNLNFDRAKKSVPEL